MKNIPPGNYLPVIFKTKSNKKGLQMMIWGLVPSFTKKSDKPNFFRMFNARSETLDEKVSFKRLLPSNRCAVLIDGFYEWKNESNKKQPYYVHVEVGKPMYIACIFDTWVPDQSNEAIYTFSIITQDSSPALTSLHDRQPFFLLDEESLEKWLNPSSSQQTLNDLLSHSSESPINLKVIPVTDRMNKPSCQNDDSTLAIAGTTDIKQETHDDIKYNLGKRSREIIKESIHTNKNNNIMRLFQKKKTKMGKDSCHDGGDVFGGTVNHSPHLTPSTGIVTSDYGDEDDIRRLCEATVCNDTTPFHTNPNNRSDTKSELYTCTSGKHPTFPTTSERYGGRDAALQGVMEDAVPCIVQANIYKGYSEAEAKECEDHNNDYRNEEDNILT